MRLYGGKTIRNIVDSRIRATNETRDAILWDIDPISQVCRVKIQGSPHLITAHFPRNWKVTPYWLKRGNAVSVRHRNGTRGYVEVIGEGRAIPSPVGGPPMPHPQPIANGWITGGELSATTPPSMYLTVTSGTYRISGVVYAFSPGNLQTDSITMDIDPIMVLGSGQIMYMDTLTYNLEMDAAPAAGYFRYDMFCVGTDGEVHYLKGTAAKTNPVKPALPSDHVVIGDYILVQGGATTINNTDIGAEWKASRPTSLYVVFDQTFEWSNITDTPTRTIAITLKDQYGSGIKSSFTLTLHKVSGTGRMYSANSGWHTSTVTQNVTNGTGYTFTYERDQASTEHSPILMASISVGVYLQSTIFIKLLDSNGEVIY